MSTLGFDNYVEPLKVYLQKYREAMKGDKQPGEGEFEGLQEEMLGRDDKACKRSRSKTSSRSDTAPNTDLVVIEIPSFHGGDNFVDALINLYGCDSN